MKVDGLTARQWALLVDGANATRADEQRWQRWLSGRSAMPVHALSQMAEAADLGPRAVFDIAHQVAERRDAYLERQAPDE